MWVCYVIALIPIVAGAFLWLRTRRITFGEWMRGSAIGLLVAIGFHVYAIATLTLDTQIVSGSVTHMTHYPRYSGGESDLSWGEHWAVTVKLHDGRADFEIPEKEFEAILEKFGAPALETAMPEVRRPDDDDYRVHVAANRTGALIPAWTIRLARRQHAGPSVFSFSEPPEGQPLFDYPYGMSDSLTEALIHGLGRQVSGDTVTMADYQNYDWRRSSRLLGRAADDIRIEKWDALTAKLGLDLGVNLIAIGFNGDSSLAHWQEAKWLGGKKNDLVICYGPPGDDGKPAWTYCFGWSENETVKRNLESLFLTRGLGDGLMPEIENEVRAHYRPKVWPEFSYFSIVPPRGAVEILILITIVLQGGYWVLALFNRHRRLAADAVEEREEAEDQIRRQRKDRAKSLKQRLKKGLAHLGRRPTIDQLTDEMLRGREATLAAVALTRRRKREAVGPLVLGLTSANPVVRATAADWLNDSVREPSRCEEARAVVPRLIHRLDDESVTARREALRLLGLIDPDWRSHDEARREIHGLLMKLRVKQAAPAVLDALGALGPLVRDDLLALTEDVTKATAVHALRAYGRAGDPRAVPLLLEKLEGDKEIYWRAALDGLSGFGPGLRDVPQAGEVFEKVYPLLAKLRLEIRVHAIITLGWLGDDRALPDLVPLLGNPVSTTRLWTAEAVGRIGTPAAIDALVGRLEAASERDRVAIVKALGKTGDPAIIPPLIALFETARKGGALLASEIIEAIYPFGGREVKKLMKDAAADFFCSANEHAARRLPHLGEGPESRPWSA